MKRLPATKTILLTLLCIAAINPSAKAKTMYRWVDEHGKVSFSDQVPPTKVELKHEELDKNAQVVKVTERAKTKEELAIEKRLMLLRKQQEKIIAKQKAHDKKLLSNFISLTAMDASQKASVTALSNQEKDLQEVLKNLAEELAKHQKDAASYEIKNTKIPTEVLNHIEDTQKKIVQTKQEITQLQAKKLANAKEFANDRARYVFLTQSKTNSDATVSEPAAEKIVLEPGLFNCNSAAQCEKAWGIAKEFVTNNSTAKITIDTDSLFMTDEPVVETDMNLSISKMTVKDGNPQIFLDIRCTDTVAGKILCSSPKADEIRSRFIDDLKTKLNTAPAPAATPTSSEPTAKPAAEKK
jgi:hypothetical protein